MAELNVKPTDDSELDLTEEPNKPKRNLRRGVAPYEDPSMMYDEAGNAVEKADVTPGEILPKMITPGSIMQNKEAQTDAEGDDIHPPAGKPKSNETEIKRLQAEIEETKRNLPANSQEFYKEEFKKLSDERADALKIFRKNEDRQETAQLAETIGQALAQLGAARQGLNTGVDMSGLKFNKTDWKDQYNRILKDLDVQLDDINSRKGEVKERQEDIYKQVKSVAEAHIDNLKEDIRNLTADDRIAASEFRGSQKDREAFLRNQDRELKEKQIHLQQASGTLDQFDKGQVKDRATAKEQLNKNLAYGAGKTPLKTEEPTRFLGIDWGGGDEDYQATKQGVDSSIQEIQKRRAEIQAELQGGKQPAATPPPSTPAQPPAPAASSNPNYHGPVVTQNGKRFKWDGAKYVPE